MPAVSRVRRYNQETSSSRPKAVLPNAGFCSRLNVDPRRIVAHFSWRRAEERDCMLPTSAKEKNFMRVAYVVLMLLAFLSGCAARPVIRDQQSASVFSADQNSGSQCAGPNWDACR